MNDSKKPENIVHISEENLEASFRTLGPSMAVSKGHYELPSVAEVRDLDWNHMDHHHRHHVHQLYEETLRIARGADCAASLTRIRVGPFKFFVLVTDLRIKPGVFYQVFTIFNLIYVHTITRSIPGKGVGEKGALRTVRWYIVSPRWFKFLHPSINRKMDHINKAQNPQDAPVLKWRTDIRKKGFSFASDNPDYLNSNLLTMNVRYPKLGQIHRIPVENLPLDQVSIVSAGPIDLLVRRQADHKIEVWLRNCPHEGAPLETGILIGCEFKCPWHGLKFSALVLDQTSSSGKLANFEIKLSSKELVISGKS